MQTVCKQKNSYNPEGRKTIRISDVKACAQIYAPLLIALTVFIILKAPHLFYPFYRDESWPYASGVMHMYLHGPSMLPGAIDGELSAGIR